jgi:hypothetical protein
MRWLKKIVAGFLLLWGLPISIWATLDTFNPETPTEDKEGAIAALCFFGLPPVAISGLLIHSLRQQHRLTTDKSDRALEQLFLSELQANNGVISPVMFATKANLTLEEAKAFLDDKAVQLNAFFEATDTGGIVYHFPV